MSFAVSVDPEVPQSNQRGQTLETTRTPLSPPEAFVAERLREIKNTLGDPEILEATRDSLEALSEDAVNKPGLLAWIKEGIAKRDRRYEIRSALRALARVIKPRTYLEIGTRRGWSLAQVASEAPDARIWSLDLWISDYGGVSNPGPEFVHGEVCRVAPDYRGKITYIDGNSHDVLPVFLDGCFDPMTYPDELALVRESENRPRRFDLVTVDGDHTAQGAWWDLNDMMPRVALGGALVFDDLVDTSDEVTGGRAAALKPARVPTPPELRHSLRDVWQRIQNVFPEFTYIDSFDSHPPIGIAIRTR